MRKRSEKDGMNPSRVRWGLCIAIALTLLAPSGLLPTRLSFEIREMVRRH